MENPLITICFRKDSKRLPGKNVKSLFMKPLWQWTAKHAYDWQRGHIVISSDYPVNGRGLLLMGFRNPDDLTYIDRPPELAKDNIPKLSAICHAHKEMERIHDQEFDPIIDLDVCNPVRRVEDIEGCYQKFLHSWQDVVFSVTPARRNPYFNMVERGLLGDPRLCKTNAATFTQEVFDINCCIYVYSRDFLMTNPKSPTDVPFEIYEMPIESRFDIDTQADWDCVEMVMSHSLGENQKTGASHAI